VCLLKASWEEPKGARTTEQPTAKAVKTLTVQVDDLAPLDVTVSARVDGLALSGKHRIRVFAVATDDQVIHFHRFHRGPEDHPVISRRFSAQADSARDAQGQCARVSGAGGLVLAGRGR
jgi:hypothetical protein